VAISQLAPATAVTAAATARRPHTGRMIGVALAWGACFVAISWGLRDAPVLWFAALRALLAGAALVTLGGVQHRPLPRQVRTWALIGLLGLLNATLALAAMFAAGAGAAKGVATVLANAQPLLILLPAWWLYGQRPNRSTTIALLLGLAGLTVVASASGAGAGAGLSLAAGAATTAGTLLARRLRDVDVIVVAGWHLLLGGVGLAVWAAVSEGLPDIAWTGRFVAALAFLALVGTAATTVIWFTEAQHARLDQLTTWTLLVPVVGLLLAALLLGERPTGWTLLGLGAVLAALWFAQRPDHTPPAAHHGLLLTAPTGAPRM
jgi:drug/metabolite transporter (DMT)-like permease